jgi:hypothetical protein
MSFGNVFSYPEGFEENTSTRRAPKSSLLLINSKDSKINGVQNGTYNNYFINTQKIVGLGQIKRVGVSEVIFPWITPNVNNGYNYNPTPNPDPLEPPTQPSGTNTFVFAGLVAGVVQCFYVKLPERFFSAADATTSLLARLNSLAFLKNIDGTPATSLYGVFNVQYNTNSDGLINIANNLPFVICTIPKQYEGVYTINSYLSELMGFIPKKFDSITAANFTTVARYTGNFPLMTYTTYVDVCSNALCKFQKLKDSLTQYSYTNVICRIYFTTPTNLENFPFGQQPCPSFYVKFSNVKFMEWNPDQMIGGIDIQYFDDKGQPLYIPTTVNPNTGVRDLNVNQIFTLIMSDS